jgi:AcrR family transcriptional regulator
MALLRLQMNKNLFLRDPQETDLGRKIIRHSISMIEEMGMENFTFRKLSVEIDSTEASIYRYFENKHRLLVYLIAWYWNWLEYKIEYETNNVADPRERLAIAIRLVAEKKCIDPMFPSINEAALQRIVINESDKTYHTKQVDNDNKEGLFYGFKSLCKRIASIVKEINPQYAYAHALISTTLEAAHQQVFFAEHLPALTEHKAAKGNVYAENNAFLLDFIEKTIL